jgi:potassium-dependent mechanosensitive channel
MSAIRIALACAIAVFAGTSLGQQPEIVRGIAAENASLSTQLTDEAAALDRALAELADVRKTSRDLEERMHRVEARAAVYALGQEFAQTLTELLHQLPESGRFALASGRHGESLAAVSDANLRAERALSDLDDLEAALATRLAAAQPPIAQEQRPEVEPAVRTALAEQRDLLERLTAAQQKRLKTLRETEDAERDLERQGEAARVELTRFLFWIPAPPSTKTVGGIVPALAWTVSPTNWRAAREVMGDELARGAFWFMVVLLVAASLFASRGRLQRALESLSPVAVTYERYRIGHALAAFVITFALALPIPMVLWAAGMLLSVATDSQRFALALGAALQAISKLVLAISTLAWLLDRRGVAIRHFGWDEALDGVARELRRLAAVFVPLMFIAALNGLDHAPFANRESLGRLAFSLAMITLATFLVRLLRRRNPLMQRLLTRAPRSWAAQLHAVWFGALVAVPLAIAVLSVAGYFVAAAYFFGRIVDSVFLAIGAVMLYGLMALWVQVQRLQLAHRSDEERARTKQTGVAGEAGSEVADVRPTQLDFALIGEQTRSLLYFAVTVLLIAGIGWVWRGALPALSVIADYALWSYTGTADGKEVVHFLTVGHLLLAIVVGVVTIVVVRNVGAFLDIVLLRRLEVQTDATYAIKVIARYAVTAVGLLIACDILGIRWGDVQWLVAALGVGLGFGLQEIVANFVSGIIVLAERPIRIGDVVTVGGVSGTVARIRARATAVIDFDNKEVIIPNKAFITERVVNWTLSNQTTRLLIKVGVAYGSDIALVQRVILDAVRGNRDVLKDPAPSVFFVAFGDSTLDFEIRAFVDSIDKRLRVQHEINLEVARVLGENGIEIPFPQRDVHVRSAPG